MHEQGLAAVQEPLEHSAESASAAELNAAAEQEQKVYSVQHGNGEVHSGTLDRAREECPALKGLPNAILQAALELQSIGQDAMAAKAQKSAKATSEAAERSRATSIDAILDRQPKAKPTTAEKQAPAELPQTPAITPAKVPPSERVEAAPPVPIAEQATVTEVIPEQHKPAVTVEPVKPQETKPVRAHRVEKQPEPTLLITPESSENVVSTVPVVPPAVIETSVKAVEQTPVPAAADIVVSQSTAEQVPQVTEQHTPVTAAPSPTKVTLPVPQHNTDTPPQTSVGQLPVAFVEQSIPDSVTVESEPAEDLATSLETPGLATVEYEFAPVELTEEEELPLFSDMLQTTPYEEQIAEFSEAVEPLTTQEIIGLADELTNFEPSKYLSENTAAIAPKPDTPFRPAVEVHPASTPSTELITPVLPTREAAAVQPIAPAPLVESFAKAIQEVEASPVPTAPVVQQIAEQLQELPETKQAPVESILVEIAELATELQELPAEMPAAAAEMVREKIEALCCELLTILAIAPNHKAAAALRTLLLSPTIAHSITRPGPALPETVGTHERKHGWLGQQWYSSKQADDASLPQLMGSSLLAAYAPA